MFSQKCANFMGRDAIIVSGLVNYSLTDTFECGQCFRFVKLSPTEGGEVNTVGREYPDYVEYMTVVKDTLIFVGQKDPDELIFFGVDEDTFDGVCVPYFSLDADYPAIKDDIVSRTDSEFLIEAANAAEGIRILRQQPWEALFSFIISQNNNIPRIKKIIRNIAASYGENLALTSGLTSCPLKLSPNCDKLDTDACSRCGICYTFPTPEQVIDAPELLLPSHPGFRYKYLVDAAERVVSREVDLEKIAEISEYDHTMSELVKIKGVGEKVASCTALFGFSNLEAFPIDVWMKRAIDEYFEGKLDPVTLGKYAGVAQQYIFHYIRLMSQK